MKSCAALQNFFMIFVRLHNKRTLSRVTQHYDLIIDDPLTEKLYMSRKQKFPQDSLVSMTELVLPNDTNTLNNLMGGRLMHWMDIVSAIAAQKHSNRIVVTASVDNISFKHPIQLGNVVTLRAKVTRSFHSSMEVRIDVEAEDVPSGKKMESNNAYFTFVAMDEKGKPTEVPEVIPQTDDEKNLFESALRRRQLRLILAGRMKPSEANELKSIFDIKES
jgi:acyl-CoA hydrolase